MDTEELLDAHLDAVWRQVATVVADGDRVADVVVGTFRAAGAGADAPSLSAAARRLVGRTPARRTGVITRLDVHAEPPALTDTVRAGVRARVLADTDDRAPRVGGRGVGVGAAVLVVIVVLGVVWFARAPTTPTAAPPTTVVPVAVADAATAAAGERQRADTDLAARAGFPASGDLVTDQHLARCADAVRRSGRTASYPAVATWRVGETQAGATGVTTVVSDAFACATTPTTVFVSGTSGVAVGDVQVVRAGPGQIVLLNPGGVLVTLSVLHQQTDPRSRTSDDKAQLVGVAGGVFGNETAPFGLAVGGPGLPFDGVPLPDPGPTAVQLVDNRITPPDRTSTAGAQLGRCLASTFGNLTPDPDAWNATTAGVVDGATVVLAHAYGMAGLCAEREGRQVFTSFPVTDPAPAGALTAVTQIGAVGGSPQSYTLFTVDSRAVRLEVEGARLPVSCLASDGVGVCVRTAGVVDPATLRAYDSGGALVAGPGPLS